MTVLIVAAHPDDEVLGVGGTAARHAASGEAVEVLICATGLTSRGPAAAGELAELEATAGRVADVLGTARPRFLGYRDNEMDAVPLLGVVKAISAVTDAVRPRIVYTHHPGDLNIDHVIVARAVLTALRPQPGHGVEAIYGFETMSSTEWSPPTLAEGFLPQHFIDIAPFMDVKRAALACYAGEMRPFPHARSVEAVEALARYRGASAGFRAAEAFTVLRSFWAA